MPRLYRTDVLFRDARSSGTCICLPIRQANGGLLVIGAIGPEALVDRRGFDAALLERAERRPRELEEVMP
jgi:hypothetical protein